MAFGWAKGLLKKKETLTKRVPVCEHDLEDKPLVPMLPMNMRQRLETSWTKPHDAGLLRAANQMYSRMVETLTAQQINELNQAFTYMETNEGYASLAAARPFKDKCYYILKMINDLVNLLCCVPCLNNKVDKVLHGNNISEHHYNMLKDYIMWTVELYNSQTFTNRRKAAWGVFFACIWDAIEGSPGRHKTKQRKQASKQVTEMEQGKEMEGTKETEQVGGNVKVMKKVKFDDGETKKVKHHNVDVTKLKFDDIGVVKGEKNKNKDKTQGIREDKDKEEDDKTKDKEGDSDKGSIKDKEEAKDKGKGKHSDKKECKDDKDMQKVVR